MGMVLSAKIDRCAQTHRSIKAGEDLILRTQVRIGEATDHVLRLDAIIRRMRAYLDRCDDRSHAQSVHAE